MKPSWEIAPDWANWLAQDESGVWYWFEERPIQGGCTFQPTTGRMLRHIPDTSWDKSLEERPE